MYNIFIIDNKYIFHFFLCQNAQKVFYFILNFRKVPKEFHLDYDKLEDRPSLPTNLAATAQGPHSGVPAVPPSSAGSPAPPQPMGSMSALQQAQISPNMNSGGPGMPPPGGL